VFDGRFEPGKNIRRASSQEVCVFVYTLVCVQALLVRHGNSEIGYTLLELVIQNDLVKELE